MRKSRRSAQDEAGFEGMGRAVRELRETRGMSRAALASKAGIVPATLRAIERGETDAKWGTLRSLASALTIPLDALIDMAEERAAEIMKKARKR